MSEGKQAEEKKKTTAVKGTETAKEVRMLVKKMYTRAHEARELGRKVAWCMYGVPGEITEAFDVVRVYPENYAGLCAAKKAERPFIERAEAEGFDTTLCSYSTTTIGFVCMRQELGMIPQEAPDRGMADPDMLISCSAFCEPRYKWFQTLEHYMDVPHFAFDWICHMGAPEFDLKSLKEHYKYHVQYHVDELKEFIAFLERQTGKRIDWDKLREKVWLALQALNTYQEVFQMGKVSPCPIAAEDLFSTLVPQYFMLGEPETVDFYTRLRDEVKYRVENKIGVIPNERYRLLWAAGLPPWHTMELLNYFESLGAVCVTEAAYGAHLPLPDPDEVKTSDPLELVYIKESNLHENIFYGPRKVKLIMELIRDYRVDGIIWHRPRSCRPSIAGVMYPIKRVEELTKIPVIVLDSDIVDSREYFETQTKRQINAFIEILETRKQVERQV